MRFSAALSSPLPIASRLSPPVSHWWSAGILTSQFRQFCLSGFLEGVNTRGAGAGKTFPLGVLRERKLSGDDWLLRNSLSGDSTSSTSLHCFWFLKRSKPQSSTSQLVSACRHWMVSNDFKAKHYTRKVCQKSCPLPVLSAFSQPSK